MLRPRCVRIGMERLRVASCLSGASISLEQIQETALKGSQYDLNEGVNRSRENDLDEGVRCKGNGATIVKQAGSTSTFAVPSAETVRGFSASAAEGANPKQEPANELYARAVELLQEVQDAAEASGQPAEDNDELRGKLEEAAECLEISLRKGRNDPRVPLALARLYEKFSLSSGPSDGGLSYLYQAAEAGSSDAQYELACRLKLQEDDADPRGGRSRHYLLQAAAQGHRDAMFLLGAAEYSSSDEEPSSAKEWFKRAADLGHIPASTIYGILVLKDLEGSKSQPPKSASKAKEYLELAAKQGEPLAAEWLMRIDR